MRDQWTRSIVSHMSDRMCAEILGEIMDRFGFDPPMPKTYNLTPDGYHDHNRYFNYVENFMIRHKR